MRKTEASAAILHQFYRFKPSRTMVLYNQNSFSYSFAIKHLFDSSFTNLCQSILYFVQEKS